MTVKETKVYKCDFCKKKSFMSNAMVRHERWCNSNPVNFKACIDCQNLEETTVDYEIQIAIDDFRTNHAKAFRCTRLDRLLYPTKVEQKGLPEKYPNTFENQYPMPTNCTLFQAILPF